MLNTLPSIQEIWSISNHNFNAIALEIFRFQVKNNPVYAQYLELIDQAPDSVDHYTLIPCLPISFFKTHQVVSKTFEPEAIFESSTTTGSTPSRKYVAQLNEYHQTCLTIIEDQIGDISKYHIAGLLPNYLERQNSSLVSMVKFLMDHNQQQDGFYLYNHEELFELLQNPPTNKPVLLFGVSFALLDFAANFGSEAAFTIVETGGMKGRKKEITKQELYQTLQGAFSNATILSEYGMTELMSQTYSTNTGIYTAPPWMKVLPRADNDPLSHTANGRSAALNIIDLANIDTCAFIATDDIGRIHPDGTFEVSGRLDYADMRGCSMMAL